MFKFYEMISKVTIDTTNRRNRGIQNIFMNVFHNVNK